MKQSTGLRVIELTNVLEGGKNKYMDESEKTIEEADKYAPLMFHPVHERGKEAWHPGNDAAYIASNISHTWEDIQCLLRIRQNCPTDWEGVVF